MPAQELENVKKSLSDQDSRIKSLEITVSATLPPLLEKLDEHITSQHELSLSIRDLIGGLAQNSKEIVMFSNRLDKQEAKFTELKEEVIETRPLVKVVKGLGVKIFWFSFTVAVGAITVAFAVVMAARLDS